MEDHIFDTIIQRLTDAGGQMKIDKLRLLIDNPSVVSTSPYDFDTLLEMMIDSGRAKIKNGNVVLLFKDKPQADNKTTNIHADKVFYNEGNVNGDTDLSDNQSRRSSNSSTNPATEKQNNAIQNQIIRGLGWTIGLIASIIGIYQWLTS